jgi:hypothetical protein
MPKKSIRERLEKLESERRFLEWFVLDRFLATLTREELETWASGRGVPDPVPNRPSSLDTLDRKSLRRLWEEHNLIFEGRSKEECEFYADNGLFPEQRGRLHYFMENAKLQVEWRSQAPEGNIGTAVPRP